MSTETKNVTVHSYRIYDASDDSNDIRHVKATAEAVARFKGEIVPGTAENIDASLLDAQGVYRPKLTREEIRFLERLAHSSWTRAGLIDHRQFKRLVDQKLVKDTAVNLGEVLYEITDQGRKLLSKGAA